MGQLVFQATLGGQVALVGPNTASSYSLNLPTVNGNVVTTGDTGTVTNTMLASSAYTAPGTIGSGTPNSGAFTTLSASSTVSGSGFSTYLASPPAIGGTAAAAGTFTSLTLSGTSSNLNGDFSNATVLSRSSFKTTTVNGSTGIYALPNGTSTAASWQASNAADPTNASKILIATNGSTDVQLVSGINGTGTYLPLTFYTSGAEKMRLDTSGNVGIGTNSPGAKLEVNGNIYANPAANARIRAYNTTGTAQTTGIGADSGIGWIGSETNTPFYFATNNTERMRIDSSGNVGIGTSSPASILNLYATTKPTLKFGDSTLGNNYGGYITGYGTTGLGGFLSIGTNDNTVLSEAVQIQQQAASILFKTSTGTAGSTTERMRIDSNGNLNIGNSGNFGAKVSVNFDISSTYGIYLSPSSSTYTKGFIAFNNGSGSLVGQITTNGTATTYATSSDYRLKENVLPMVGALDTVAQLKPVTYKWKSDGSDGQGFIAHELQEVVPDCVTGEKDAVDEKGEPKYQGIDTSFLVATLTAAIQELKAIIDTQAERIAVLEAK